MHDELTPRERVALALGHEQADRVPVAMICSGIRADAHRQLERYLQRERCISVEEYLLPIIDVAGVQPPYTGPALAEGVDFWGIGRQPVSYGSGYYDEIVHYPLAGVAHLAELDDYAWPSPDWWDYAALPQLCKKARATRDYALIIGNGNIFETSWYMRGFEQMLMDLHLNPELATAILERVTDYYVAFFRRALESADGAIDLVFTADDLGGQHGLLMSLSMWERLIKPFHRRLNEALHEYGVSIVYHSDGSVMEAVPGLADAGIDVLQALQFDADGMDPVALKRDFGHRLCFQGGVSVQQTLPFGSVDEVVAEVEELITVLGRDGGYILGPSHAIQDGTPPENIVAMFDTAARFTAT